MFRLFFEVTFYLYFTLDVVKKLFVRLTFASLMQPRLPVGDAQAEGRKGV